MAQIRSKPFGVTKEGANVTEYILSNPGGMSVSVLDYGCVLAEGSPAVIQADPRVIAAYLGGAESCLDVE